VSSTPPTPENKSDAEASPTVGVLGAGQLGRMLALAAYPLGARVVFLDPSPGSPAGELGRQIIADYEAPSALAELRECDVVTYEFESVPVAAARALAEHTLVLPPPDALATAQDRRLEKECFRSLGVPTAPFRAVASEAELERAVAELGLPCVLKTRQLGYDGKGQFVLRAASDVSRAWAAIGGVPLLLEGFVPFERELSLLSVRGRDGRTAFYPLVENQHRDGILRFTWAPAQNVSRELQRTAEGYAAAILDRLAYVGVLALELFQVNGELFANEVAPRVHNSGHFSIEGARTSQFENHLRAVLGLPLGSTEVPEPCAMLNLVGALPAREDVLAVDGAHLHFYGKAPRPGRKVGHITVTAPTFAVLEERVARLSRLTGAG
jgi:5-(carboxyamino)imidazole ribonucleotide synthase